MKIALLIILTSVLLINGCAASPESSEAVVGELAPSFQLQDFDGQSVALGNLRGKPLLLNFWATRCPPCRSEMPYIQQVYDEWSGKELVVLAINIGESSAKVKEFMQSYGLSFPVLLDTNEKVAQVYNIRYIPTTFFIDGDGIIQVKIIGAFPNEAAIEENLSKIIP
jgi:peroxiredoxin